MSHTKTPHADFYQLKGLIASSHPELLEFVTEAERRYSSHDELVERLERCLNYLADLNGSHWIKDNGPGGADMRQRAKALQGLVYKTLAAAREKS